MKWFVGTVVVAAALFGGGLALHGFAPAVWDQLTTSASAAGAIVSIVGSLLGTLIAVGAAYAVLTKQVSADRRLELDMRSADVAHEAAGELSYWCDSLQRPGRSDLKLKAPVVVRELVRRRDRLEASGIPALDILKFVRMAETDWRSLQTSYLSIIRRAPAAGVDPTRFAQFVGVQLIAGEIVGEEWESEVEPHLKALDTFATQLSAWHPGSPVPALQLPDARALVCSMTELENRLEQAGYPVPRDPLLAQLGLYNENDPDS